MIQGSPKVFLLSPACPHADLDTLSATLQNGQEPVQIIEKRWGERSLDVRVPGGYILRFYTQAHRPEQEQLELYLSGVRELEAAVAGLSEADLELSLHPDSWTIRHIVHHLADSETLFMRRANSSVTPLTVSGIRV
jgi:hypothetical protein